MNVQQPNFSDLFSSYSDFKVTSVHGRYLREKDLLEVFKTLSHKFKIKNEGHSEEGRIISSFRLGKGPHKILIWSQMHGNESTTTKAVLDLLNYFLIHTEISKSILEKCRFIIVPVLNPDGAVNYTRVNSNAVDLNRDAYLKTQSESKILQSLYAEFNPDFCFNMHDQRTIFSAGETEKPATLSFLSPSFNEERDINETRIQSMGLIASANHLLQEFIPGQIGRYDDGFNINCIGDYFQKKGTPTVLFEAGHFPGDYEREQTRKYVFIALLKMIIDIANQKNTDPVEQYLSIPENEKLFYDIVLRNVNYNSNETFDIAIQFKEVLSENKIEFIPIIEKMGNLTRGYGHREINLEGQSLQFENPLNLKEGEVLASFILNDNVFVI
ncbi:M14 family zinc carboxypeptidase [Psychroflexus sediminis]|nr:M14 family zinc carboxypeptidase [Psychroflexus sediminis]